jgi:hypothetical protein
MISMALGHGELGSRRRWPSLSERGDSHVAAPCGELLERVEVGTQVFGFPCLEHVQWWDEVADQVFGDED